MKIVYKISEVVCVPCQQTRKKAMREGYNVEQDGVGPNKADPLRHRIHNLTHIAVRKPKKSSFVN